MQVHAEAEPSDVMHAEGRLKWLYRLADGSRLEANLGLGVVNAAVGRGPTVAALLLDALDFTHKSILKVAKPPRCAAEPCADRGSCRVLSDGHRLRCKCFTWMVDGRVMLRLMPTSGAPYSIGDHDVF